MTRTTTAEKVFQMLEQAAATGARCPMREQFGNVSSAPALKALARAGKIRVEIFIYNFRRVVILDGPHKGKATADPPLHGGKAPKPYLVSDAGGTFRNGEAVVGHTGPRPTMMFGKDGKRLK